MGSRNHTLDEVQIAPCEHTIILEERTCLDICDDAAAIEIAVCVDSYAPKEACVTQGCILAPSDEYD